MHVCIKHIITVTLIPVGEKMVSHGNGGGYTDAVVTLGCRAIGSLSFFASLGLQSTSCNKDWSVFLNGQIWHCPIRPIQISTN